MCLQFYYHMKGGGIGQLKIFRKCDNPQDNKLLLRLNGHQGDNWQVKSVELEPFDKNFQVGCDCFF